MNEERNQLAAGDWGGMYVSVEVSDVGAVILFDRARGSIEGCINLDAEGRFEARGEYSREGFGPRDEDAATNVVPAIFIGKVRGESMTLTVKLAGTSEEVGTYTLSRGGRARLWKRR